MSACLQDQYVPGGGQSSDADLPRMSWDVSAAKTWDFRAICLPSHFPKHLRGAPPTTPGYYREIGVLDARAIANVRDSRLD